MRIKEQLGITALVVLSMIAGFATRSHVNARDPETRVLQEQKDSRQLSAYAPNSPTDVGGRSDVDLRPLEVFYSALQHVREDYVEPIKKSQEHELTYSALKNMLDSLRDPQTRFLDPEQVALIQQARTGKFEGIGASLWVRQAKQGGITEEQVVVAGTFSGSPARKVGLQTGDVITELDGKTILPYDPFQRVEKLVTATRNGKLTPEKLQKLLESENDRIKNGITFQKAIDQLTGKDGKEATLTVVRAGVKTPLKIKVQPAQTVVDPVTFARISSEVGYIHVNLLIDETGPAVAEALASFKHDGIKRLVLDLRDCPGGSLESAQAVAGDLIADRRLSILQLPRGKQRTLNAILPQGRTPWTGSVAVVVNRGTSGLTEALAAAIHDGINAKLVGSATFGDSSQQTLVALRDGSAVTMTTGKYLTPKGLDYQGKGLTPDIKVASGASEIPPANDPVVVKAIETLTKG